MFQARNYVNVIPASVFIDQQLQQLSPSLIRWKLLQLLTIPGIWGVGPEGSGAGCAGNMYTDVVVQPKVCALYEC